MYLTTSSLAALGVEINYMGCIHTPYIGPVENCVPETCKVAC